MNDYLTVGYGVCYLFITEKYIVSSRVYNSYTITCRNFEIKKKYVVVYILVLSTNRSRGDTLSPVRRAVIKTEYVNKYF